MHNCYSEEYFYKRGEKMQISIVITSFNYAKYIARAIRSCLDQSFSRENFEVLVVDDASTDHTKVILDSFGRYIRIIYLEKNIGLAEARNIGVKNARGKYIVFLDADDFLHNDFLKVCLLYLTFNFDKMDAVATDYFLVDDTEEHLKKEDCSVKPLACGVVYKKEHLSEVGLYDSKIGIGEDVDYRIRFLQKYTIGRVQLPLYRYRMHETNMTKDSEKNQVNLEIVRQKHGLNKIDSPYARNELTANVAVNLCSNKKERCNKSYGKRTY